MFLRNSRGAEVQADGLGVRYVTRAGWDPGGVPQMLTTLGRIDEAADNKGVPNWLATHPAPEDRVRRVQAAVQQAEVGASRFDINRDEYLKRINGIVYGDNPDQGVVQGRRFLHRDLRFAVDFPQGWEVNNGQAQVVAKEPGGTSLMILQLVQAPQGRPLQDVALQSMQRAGFRPLSGGETMINGLAAFVGTYEGSLPDLGRVRVRAAHIGQDRSVFLMVGASGLESYEKTETTFSQSINSFRSLTPAEAEGVQPNRISLYSARAGDTWQSIAEHQGKGIVKATTLAIMNNHAVNDQPRPGERLKIVIAG